MNYEDTKHHRRTVYWYNDDMWMPATCFYCGMPGRQLIRYCIQNSAFDDGDKDTWLCPRCGTMIKRTCRFTGTVPKEDTKR